MAQDYPKTATSSQVVYQNPWITVREDRTVTQDSGDGLYGYVESEDSCMILVENDQSELFLVRAFRYPSRSYGWELPGGGGEGEDPIVASKRELEEETGILALSWQKLGEAYVCNGLMTEKMTVCLARDLTFDGQKESSDEKFSDMRFFTEQEVEDLIINGDINDCQTLTGLQYYNLYKNKGYQR